MYSFSPRATLDGFLDSINRAYALLMETNAALKTRPPAITAKESREAETSALKLIECAIDTPDMSQTLVSTRDDIGMESVIQLK